VSKPMRLLAGLHALLRSTLRRSGPTRRVVFAACIAAVGVPRAGTAQVTFTGLGDLPGGDFLSLPLGISADGSVAVGLSVSDFEQFSDVEQGFRWTEAEGMAPLGNLSGAFASRANGVSADGQVVVGDMSESFEYAAQAVRWTAGESPVGLGFLPTDPGGPYGFQSHANAASANGSVIVGDSSSGSTAEAFRWTEAGGMVGLGHLPGDIESYATGVSVDGSVVIGASRFQDSETFLQRPYRWTAATGMVSIGQLPGGNWGSASGVSADGSVIVGDSAFSDYPAGDIGWVEAFRWTEAEGVVGLGFLPGDTYSAAYATSADGSIVVGQGTSAAFVWDAAHGMRSLRNVLASAYGLELTGWTLGAATAISADGRTIVGDGTNPSGQTEAWLAVLPSLPPQCSDGIDNDGDGLVDLDDPDCLGDPNHPRELPACSDGIDDDGDGFIDFDGGASANGGVPVALPDPGCLGASGRTESPACQDGIDNDGDEGIDFDGGAAANHGVALGRPDVNCIGSPSRDYETLTPTCGLGAELALVMPLLMWLRGYPRRQTRKNNRMR